MDIINVQPILDEVDKVLEKVKDYFFSLAAFLDDPVNTPPMFYETVVPHITYADSLGVAYSTKDLSANKASGYMVDAVNMLSATDREAGIRFKSKAAYYADSFTETGVEVGVYETARAEYRAGMTGNISST